MKKNEIERLYTAKVAELLNQGWCVHASTMPGHQGEIAHIDLTDGSEIRRVLLFREMVCGSEESDFYGNTINIVVGRNTERVWPGWDSTIWNSRLEYISQIRLAEIQEPTRRHPEGWYTDMDTAARVRRIRHERRKAQRHESRQELELGTAFKSIALRWLRKQPRMKSARLEDITRMTRYTTSENHVGFKIEAKGKTFYLHA